MFYCLNSRFCFAALALLFVFNHVACSQQPATNDTWPVAGQQGLVRFVIVPLAASRDRAAYDEQVKRLCDAEKTCFLNFYTNSTNAPVTMPLPDAIDHEATVVYRHSAKNGVEKFQWSCRLKINSDPCF